MYESDIGLPSLAVNQKVVKTMRVQFPSYTLCENAREDYITNPSKFERLNDLSTTCLANYNTGMNKENLDEENDE